MKPELAKAIDRLITAAKRREYPLGDPSALIFAKSQLRDAAQKLEELIKEEGK